MDEINKEIVKEKTGPKIKETDIPIGCLLWMDDVAFIADKPETLQNMLDVTYNIATRYHIEFGK